MAENSLDADIHDLLELGPSKAATELAEMFATLRPAVHGEYIEGGKSPSGEPEVVFVKKLEKDGVDWLFWTNFEIPTHELRERAKTDKFHEGRLMRVANSANVYSELVRRGFGEIPSDDSLSTMKNGQPIAQKSSMAFYINPNVDHPLLRNFRREVDDACNGVDIMSSTRFVTPEEVSEVIDYFLTDEKYKPLQDHYIAHMEQIVAKANAAGMSKTNIPL